MTSGLHPHPNDLIFASVIKAQNLFEFYMGYYPPNLFIKMSTLMKFYPNKVCARLLTLNSNRKKKTKLIAPTFPIRHAIKWHIYFFLSAKKLKRSLQEGNEFFEDDARHV